MIKKITQYIIHWVQRVFITVLLTLLYIVGFGVTALAVSVFRPSLMRQDSTEEQTFWHPAETYDIRLSDTQRQS